MTRPTIEPTAAAAITAKIPPRLVAKLDADPAMAERWTWADAGGVCTVATDKGETVRLAATDGVIRDAAWVTCSCLLQPKCMHVAAVVAVLAPAAPSLAPSVDTASPVIAAALESAAVEHSSSTVGAAQYAFRVVAEILAAGAETTGAFAQAELLRAIHACRTAGLHRLAASQTRALRSIRELRADRAEFSLSVLTSDLRDALAVGWAIGHTGDSSPSLVGTARRDYEPIGSLRLRGVFTEAIVARSGYAGAVTYLVAETGALYTRADVAAGDAARAVAAYDAAAGIGDAVVAHRELCRTGLFVSDATASVDGRLGGGQRVRAVRATEPSRWDHSVIAARWQIPLRDQLARLAEADASPDDLRAAGWDVVFVDGSVLGGVSGGALFDAGGTVVTLATSYDHRGLAARDNLVALARAPGLRLRVIARARLGSPRRLDLLAFAPGPEESRLAMPEAWFGRVNAHYDRVTITPGDRSAATVATVGPVAMDDLLAPLRRRIERVARGGVGTLPTHAIAEIDHEAATLADRALRGGAELLRDLAATAHDAGRGMTGARRAIDRRGFARAWLRASVYEHAARRRLSVAAW